MKASKCLPLREIADSTKRQSAPPATTTTNGSTQTALVYNYDKMGRVEDLWQCAPYNCGSSSIWHMAYGWDLAGDMLNYTNPAGFTVSRTIDSAQQVTSQTYGANMAVSSITYTPWGAISTMCGGQGCTQSQETRQYNSRLQPVLMELGNSNNPSADYSLAYSYTGGAGDNGDITGSTYTDNINPGYSHTFTYSYDGVNRLTHAVATGSPAYDLAYQYDQYGNGWCVGGSGGGVCPAVTYNSSTNQLTSIGGATPVTVTYDAAGNQLNDQYFSYLYDAEGRVKLSSSLTNPLSQCPASVEAGPWQCPVYNALGQRVEDYQADSQGNPMTLTYPQDIFGHRTGTFAQWPSQNWTGWNVYWSQVAGQRLNMGGSSAYIDHSDAVGSTTMETDPSGAVQWDVTHYPWGRVFQEQGTRQSEVAMGLDWQVNDPTIPSATREYNFRIYRWMTPDPGNAGADVGDSQSWDMYSYADDNPTTDSDPSGLDCIHFSPSPGSIIVGVESGTCSGGGGVYVNGKVDQKSLTYNGSDLGYSYAPYSGGSGTGVIGFGAPTSSSDLSPFTLGALSLAGNWASTGIRNAAENMAINGALVGIGGLIDMGAEALLATRESSVGTAGVMPTEGQVASISRTFAQSGREGVERALGKYERRLAEHLADLERYKQSGGYTSVPERGIRNFRGLIQAAKDMLSRLP